MAKEALITGETSERQFILGRKLGSGDLGSVYRARENDTIYALKLPRYSDVNADEDQILTKEAIIQQELSPHPHISPVVLFDRCRDDLSPIEVSPFIVSPRASTDLSKFIRRKGALLFDQAYSLSEKLGGALAAAHSKNIVVCDLKPENVLLDLDRNASRITGKLTDFGGAAHIGNIDELWFADWDYAAPEFHEIPSPVDHSNLKVDQYGWASGIVYPSFTGHMGSPQPFQKTIPDRMNDLYEAVETVARRALAENPLERYAGGMEELLDDFSYRRIKVEEAQNRKRRTFT